MEFYSFIFYAVGLSIAIGVGARMLYLKGVLKGLQQLKLNKHQELDHVIDQIIGAGLCDGVAIITCRAKGEKESESFHPKLKVYRRNFDMKYALKAIQSEFYNENRRR